MFALCVVDIKIVDLVVRRAGSLVKVHGVRKFAKFKIDRMLNTPIFICVPCKLVAVWYHLARPCKFDGNLWHVRLS